MSMKAFHAMITLIIGFSVGLTWLRVFWSNARSAPVAVIASELDNDRFGIAVIDHPAVNLIGDQRLVPHRGVGASCAGHCQRGQRVLFGVE